MTKVGSVVITVEEHSDRVVVYIINSAPSVEMIVGIEEYGAKVSFEHWHSDGYGEEVAEFNKETGTLDFKFRIISPDIVASVVTLISMNYHLQEVDIGGALGKTYRSRDLHLLQRVTEAFGAKLLPEFKTIEKGGAIIVDMGDGTIFIPKDIKEEFGFDSNIVEKKRFQEFLENFK